MSGIDQTLNEIAEEFELIGDRDAQYEYVIELGKALPRLSPAEQTEANALRGCASPAWLVTEPQTDGTLVFRGDSEAVIPRGIIGVLLRLYSGRTPDEILAFDAREGLARLGLSNMLSMSRANGLASMVARIRADAERLS